MMSSVNNQVIHGRDCPECGHLSSGDFQGLHTVGPEKEQMVPFTELCNPVMSVQAFHYSLAIS